mmetsp:Transcript_455/g.892  ORF Transcript_455/g.892 Transcript_455/m.892 type:complete len:205 (-) Transcript_455:347-961(-)
MTRSHFDAVKKWRLPNATIEVTASFTSTVLVLRKLLCVDTESVEVIEAALPSDLARPKLAALASLPGVFIAYGFKLGQSFPADKEGGPNMPQCPDLKDVRMPPIPPNSPSASGEDALTISCPSFVDKSTNCPFTKVSLVFGCRVGFIFFMKSPLAEGSEDCLINSLLAELGLLRLLREASNSAPSASLTSDGASGGFKYAPLSS